MIARSLGLDAAFLERLERISLVARRPMRGPGTGGRRSTQGGSSLEFADYRTYAPGDDFRRVDWNAYARLERLFLRIFEAEENRTVSIIVDCSTSMGGGEPAKSRLARQIGASLAYLALASYDAVAVLGMRDQLGPYLPPRSGRDRAPEVWRFIGELPEEGATAYESLKSFSAFNRRPGLTVLLTDMLSESDWRQGLRALLAARQEVTLLQILAPQELRPDLDGDWTLVDAETGRQVELSARPAVLRRYTETLAAYQDEISRWCRSQRVTYAHIASDTAIDEVMLRLLRRLGVTQ